jgi:hypothetical protein
MLEASKQSPPVSESEDTADDRRQFLKTSAKLAGVLAALGVTQEAVLGRAADQPRRAPAEGQLRDRTVTLSAREQALGSVLQQAIRMKSMSAAIEKSPARGQLTAADRAALATLDERDLAALARIDGKLKDKIGAAAVGIGVF